MNNHNQPNYIVLDEDSNHEYPNSNKLSSTTTLNPNQQSFSFCKNSDFETSNLNNQNKMILEDLGSKLNLSNTADKDYKLNDKVCLPRDNIEVGGAIKPNERMKTNISSNANKEQLGVGNKGSGVGKLISGSNTIVKDYCWIDYSDTNSIEISYLEDFFRINSDKKVDHEILGITEFDMGNYKLRKFNIHEELHSRYNKYGSLITHHEIKGKNPLDEYDKGDDFIDDSGVDTESKTIFNAKKSKLDDFICIEGDISEYKTSQYRLKRMANSQILPLKSKPSHNKSIGFNILKQGKIDVSKKLNNEYQALRNNMESKHQPQDDQQQQVEANKALIVGNNVASKAMEANFDKFGLKDDLKKKRSNDDELNTINENTRKQMKFATDTNLEKSNMLINLN